MELLRTERVSLRRWALDDTAAFLSIYGRDDVMRWLGPPPRRTVADLAEARARIERWHARAAGLQPPFGLWAMVEFARSDVPVGTVLLMPLTDADGVTDDVEIGWHLHPDRQHRGLVTEGARALLARAAATGVPRVLALTNLDNAPSQAVAHRLGMVDDGTTDRWFGFTTRQYSIALGTRGRTSENLRAGGATSHRKEDAQIHSTGASPSGPACACGAAGSSAGVVGGMVVGMPDHRLAMGAGPDDGPVRPALS